MIKLHTNRECAKQTVMAIIVTKDNELFIGLNDCDNPQSVCPRKDYPTGQGYEYCKSVCSQTGHAEENACKIAGIERCIGATLYLIGHTYCCEHCEKIMQEYGIKHVIFNKFPDIK